MFCTQCGTPFELGQNFCKHCGARVNQQPDLGTPTETPKREGPQVTTAPIAKAKAAPVGKVADDTLPYSLSGERQGISMSAIAGGCLALILAGSAAIYFGTDLLRQGDGLGRVRRGDAGHERALGAPRSTLAFGASCRSGR